MLSLKDKRVGVMMGGLSSERDVSLKSGAAVLDALRSSGINAFGLEVSDESYEGIKGLVSFNRIDVVFVAMHGGFGEDGRLQGILEKIGVLYTGPGQKASSLAMDKLVSRKFFQKAGLCIPKYRHIQKKDDRSLWQLMVKDLNYPLVVKPSDQESSIGISFIDSDIKLAPALDEAFKYGGVSIVEEFISGREITVSVFDKKALPVVEIIPKNKFFDFEAKYQK
ncbi:MAG TPA: ATP-grasp domain-containing protein, partial [Candidatus Omnitrophota bacterium]|nr:ATP-grasp domain-containing protein [Candidatus Omnitrophota bacterium]